MKQRYRRMLVGTAVLALVLGGVSLGQEPGEGDQPSMDEMMKMMREMGTPNEHHKHLAQMVGEWTYSATFTMPGSPEPMKSSGTMKTEPILGGLFIRSVWNGEFMGQPFTGISVDGFDKAKGHYTSTWRDSMSSHFMAYEGECDGTGRVRTMRTAFVDPMTGENVKEKGVMTVKDDKTIVLESWRVMPDGKEVKMMEIVSTRR